MKLLENLYVNNVGSDIYYKYKDQFFKKDRDKKNLWIKESSSPNNKFTLTDTGFSTGSAWDFIDPPTNKKSNGKIKIDEFYLERVGYREISDWLSSVGMKIKVKDSALSARIHGFKKYKDQLVGTSTLFYRFDGKGSRKDWSGNKVSIFSPEKKGFIAFCSEDLELVLPDFSKFKDLKIEKGTILKCKNDREYCGKIVKNQKVGVLAITKMNSYNNKPHIIEVLDENRNKIKVYRRDFKII
jgi:hypothetical protein